MKVLIVLFTLVAIIAADWSAKQPSKIITSMEECFKKLNVHEDLQAKIVKFDYPDVDIVHKFARCVFVNLGLFDDVNGFDMEHTLAHFGSEYHKQLRPLLEKCFDKNEETTTAEVWAYRDWTCLVKNGILSKDLKNQVNSHTVNTIITV